jgi:hypothetical protein
VLLRSNIVRIIWISTRWPIKKGVCTQLSRKENKNGFFVEWLRDLTEKKKNKTRLKTLTRTDLLFLGNNFTLKIQKFTIEKYFTTLRNKSQRLGKCGNPRMTSSVFQHIVKSNFYPFAKRHYVTSRIRIRNKLELIINNYLLTIVSKG